MDPDPKADPATGAHHRPDNPPDQALVERLRRGDRHAFQSAVRPLLAPLLGLARRCTQDPHSAEDLLQETLTQAYTSIHGFRGEASLRSWMFSILARLAQRPKRWHRGDRSTATVTVEVPDHLSADPELQSRERELAERLAEAMERLPQRQRSALHLRAVEGLDYRMIAEILGGTAAASRMLVLAARKQVMQRMGRHLEP